MIITIPVFHITAYTNEKLISVIRAIIPCYYYIRMLIPDTLDF